jgi:hypothetical protein
MMPTKRGFPALFLPKCRSLEKTLGGFAYSKLSFAFVAFAGWLFGKLPEIHACQLCGNSQFLEPEKQHQRRWSEARIIQYRASQFYLGVCGRISSSYGQK